MQLFILDVTFLEEADLFAQALALLAAPRRAKTMALRRPQDQRLCLGAGLVLRHGLATLDCTEEQCGIEPAATGKPRCTLRPHVQFNLSHSGSLVAGVFAENGPVGVDVEKMTTADVDTLSRHFFHPHERELLLLQKPAERTRFFFRLWTRKESCLKAAGYGFGMDPAVLATLSVAHDAVIFEGTHWHIQEYELSDQYALAVCSDRPHSADAPVWLQPAHMVSQLHGHVQLSRASKD